MVVLLYYCVVICAIKMMRKLLIAKYTHWLIVVSVGSGCFVGCNIVSFLIS